MASLLALTGTQPRRHLASGDVLIAAGDEGGVLYVLESGRLAVTRGGVSLATIDEPGALVGEMAVLLGSEHSATVRAEGGATVRVIEDALGFLERTPLVALHVATLACARLEATSALVVELEREARGQGGDQGFLGRIAAALGAPAPIRR